MFRRKVDKHRCPRRDESPMPDAYGDGTDTPDTYTKGHGLVGVQGDNLSCSYCGSLHPDVFMDWARRGGVLDPTDKNYKVYVDCPDENPRYGETKERRLPNGGRSITVFGRTAKFYFQHLSTDQRREFVDLYNAGTLQFRSIVIAGTQHELRFNPPPFFMQRAPGPGRYRAVMYGDAFHEAIGSASPQPPNPEPAPTVPIVVDETGCANGWGPGGCTYSGGCYCHRKIHHAGRCRCQCGRTHTHTGCPSCSASPGGEAP